MKLSVDKITLNGDCNRK